MRRAVPERVACVAVLAVLSAAFLAAGLVQAWRDAPAVDEAVDLAAGLVAVEHHDLRMNPEHGLLHHVLPAVLPALAADPVVPTGAAYDDGDWFDYTADLVSANEQAGRLQRVVFWFRVVPLLLGVATAWLLYLLTARLFGPLGGAIAGGLWLTTPYVVGLAHLSSLDADFAFVVVALGWSLLRLLDSPSGARLVEVGAVFGASLLVRHTAVVLAVGVVTVVVAAHRGQPRRTVATALVAVGVVSVGVVWVAYRAVDPVPVAGAPAERFAQLIAGARGMGVVERLAVSLPLPVEWRAGMAYEAFVVEGHPAYLVGQYWVGGRPWFQPVSGLIKLPLSASLAIAVGLVAWWGLDGNSRRRGLLALGSVSVPLAVLLLFQPLDIGFRLAVPLLALAFGAAGAAARWWARPWGRVVLGGVLVVQALAFGLSQPNSLAWTPWPFSNGYRHVSDGSLDLGHGNRVLRDRQRHAPVVAASLLAPRGFDPLPGVPPVVGAAAADLVGEIAVGATVLTVRAARELSWLRAYCPVEVVAGSILIYRFDEPPDTTPGPAVPAAPCRGELSVRDG